MASISEYRQELAEYLPRWADTTERILGSRMTKANVSVSDTARRNFAVQVLSRATGFDVSFIFRDSMRFTDMGAGRGYYKGRRITQAIYREAIQKSNPKKFRRAKSFLLRPIFGRVRALSEVLIEKTVDEFIGDFLTSLKQNQNNGITVR